MLDVSPASKGNAFRRRRLSLLKDVIRKARVRGRKSKVLDIGGTYNFWYTWREEINWSEVEIVCLNHNPSHAEQGKSEIAVNMVEGDARSLDFVDANEFDVAFSNSVIEHVGSWLDMTSMANEIRRVAPRYLVQTPYFWFPIEPHARTPFLHWLPEPAAYRIIMMRDCGFWKRQDTVSGAVRLVQSAHLLDARQMRTLFPDASLVHERFLGFTKSLIALRA
jgi:Methyltransferase domain